jgi:anti-anti-sigma factor
MLHDGCPKPQTPVLESLVRMTMRWPEAGPGGGDADEDDAVFWVSANGDLHVFDLAGELDLDTVKVLDTVPIQPDADETVVLDLAGLEFVDSSGLRSLIQVRRRVIDRGAHLVLRQPRPSVRRVFEVAGLDTVFTLEG